MTQRNILKRIRQKLDLTQEAMGEHVNFGRANICQAEKLDTAHPRYKRTLMMFCGIYFKLKMPEEYKKYVESIEDEL